MFFDVFDSFEGYLHSGRSKVTRVTVGGDTDQPKVFEFAKLIFRLWRSHNVATKKKSPTLL